MGKNKNIIITVVSIIIVIIIIFTLVKMFSGNRNTGTISADVVYNDKCKL